MREIKFRGKRIDNGECLEYAKAACEVEIIGNIFDNPELSEVTE